MGDKADFTRAEIAHCGRHLYEPTLTRLHGKVRKEIRNLIAFPTVPHNWVSNARELKHGVCN
eukprot:354533-Pyramimonas_sp.AAC.1